MTEVPAICQVGLGAHGVSQARVALEHPDAWRLASVVDGSVAARARFESRFSRHRIPFFRTLSEALAHAAVDLVVITTTAPSHVALVREAVPSGRCGRILVEKPISNDVAAARELAAELEAANRLDRVTVDFTRRHGNVYAEAKRLVDSGELGTIERVVHDNPVKVSMDGSHFIDLANWMIGEPPVSVTGRLKGASSTDHRGARFFDPEGCVSVRYPGGATFDLLDAPAEAGRPAGFRVELTEGSIFVDARETFATITSAAGERTIVSDKNAGFLQWYVKALTAVTGGADDPGASVQDGIASLEVVAAAHASSGMDGAAVELPLSSSLASQPLRIA